VWCRTLVERAADLVRLALTRDVGAAELRRAAHTDPLTGVRNRVGLAERLEVLAASSWGGLNAVIYVDLDDFKAVNDTWGHAAGDAVLVECAKRLQACLRAGDVLARHGGDEFVAVCAGVPDAEVAAAIARRIVAQLGQPVPLPHGPVPAGASVGVAVGDRAATAGLTERADAALLRAKRAGKGRVEVDDGS
jgi:diguanylate cyclase (GGDEF)-like protein